MSTQRRRVASERYCPKCKSYTYGSIRDGEYVYNMHGRGTVICKNSGKSIRATHLLADPDMTPWSMDVPPTASRLKAHRFRVVDVDHLDGQQHKADTTVDTEAKDKP